jgi:digeranylgeranylglycerophospholipid reductase
MKVALIGGGLSGLSCAHELPRNRITPTIVERKSYIGALLDFPAAKD